MTDYYPNPVCSACGGRFTGHEIPCARYVLEDLECQASACCFECDASHWRFAHPCAGLSADDQSQYLWHIVGLGPTKKILLVCRSGRNKMHHVRPGITCYASCFRSTTLSCMNRGGWPIRDCARIISLQRSVLGSEAFTWVTFSGLLQPWRRMEIGIVVMVAMVLSTNNSCANNTMLMVSFVVEYAKLNILKSIESRGTELP